MNNQVTTEFHPHVAVISGAIKTTSLKVAEHFGKRHDNVLRAIKNLECPEEFRLLNFEEAPCTDEQGKKQPCYEMTKDGFVFLAMGFTGKDAAKWKIAYINAFNAMERKLLPKAPPSTSSIETYQVKVLTTFTRGDEPTQQIVPYNSCVVDGENPVSVSTFLNEYVSSTPDMLLALSLSYISKLKNCQDAAIKQHALPPSEQIAAPLAKTPGATTSLIDQFIQDWKNTDKEIINAPFVPCLGTQVLRLFRVWAQKKGIAVRMGDNHIMSAIYQHPGFYKKHVRISSAANANPRTTLMIDGMNAPSGMTATEWIADCIDKMEDALSWMEIP